MFEANLVGMLLGSEEKTRGDDTFRSILVSSGVETLRLYANLDSQEAFDSVKSLTPGTMLDIRVSIRNETREGQTKLKLRLIDVRVAPKVPAVPAPAPAKV